MVDRPGVEVQQCMELTGTNRSRALLKKDFKTRTCKDKTHKKRKVTKRKKKSNTAMQFSENFSDKFSGDSYEDPPVPIPNTVVKLVNAEST